MNSGPGATGKRTACRVLAATLVKVTEFDDARAILSTLRAPLITIPDVLGKSP